MTGPIALRCSLLAVLGFLLVLTGDSQVEVSALIHRNGSLVFDGSLARGVLSAGERLLTIEYAHVVDNGEGQWPPHGPYGSIHVVAYRPEQSPTAPWSPELELYETMLYGPHRTVGSLYEWLDDEELAYTNYALYDWNQHELDRVTLRFYESDPGVGRTHDDLLAVLVIREETEEQTLTFRSDKMVVRLRTRNLIQQYEVIICASERPARK